MRKRPLFGTKPTKLQMDYALMQLQLVREHNEMLRQRLSELLADRTLLVTRVRLLSRRVDHIIHEGNFFEKGSGWGEPND